MWIFAGIFLGIVIIIGAVVLHSTRKPEEYPVKYKKKAKVLKFDYKLPEKKDNV